MIHPTFGPWVALRGIIALAGDPPPAAAPIAPPCRCAGACTDALARAMRSEDPAHWIALRDSCTVGSEHRYGDAQLRFQVAHHAFDLAVQGRAVLNEDLEDVQPGPDVNDLGAVGEGLQALLVAGGWVDEIGRHPKCSTRQ